MYNKPALKFSDQALKLQSRGLIGELSDIENTISKINYYRYTTYLYPFRNHPNEEFIPNTTLELINEIYCFDSKLREFTFKYIQEIEISILRTLMVEKFTLEKGAFGYLSHENFKDSIDLSKYEKIKDDFKKYTRRSNEDFVDYYFNKYDNDDLPLWMLAEISTFGTLSEFYENLPVNISKEIAKIFNLNYAVLYSWFHSLTIIRNICAHHSRLWNRIYPITPKIPTKKNNPEFHILNGKNNEKINNRNYFFVFIMLKYLINTLNPNNTITEEFEKLLIQYPNIKLYKLGFPENWKEHEVLK